MAGGMPARCRVIVLAVAPGKGAGTRARRHGMTAIPHTGEAIEDTLWRPFYQHSLRQQPLVIAGAHGSTVVDAQGKEYLDAMAGLWCVNVGYGQQRLVDAAAAQMQRL